MVAYKESKKSKGGKDLEYEEITVKLPKQVLKYIRAVEDDDAAEYITGVVCERIKADLETGISEALIARFSLAEVFGNLE